MRLAQQECLRMSAEHLASSEPSAEHSSAVAAPLAVHSPRNDAAAAANNDAAPRLLQLSVVQPKRPRDKVGDDAARRVLRDGAGGSSTFTRRMAQSQDRCHRRVHTSQPAPLATHTAPPSPSPLPSPSPSPFTLTLALADTSPLPSLPPPCDVHMRMHIRRRRCGAAGSAEQT